VIRAESVIKNPCDLRKEEGPKTIRQLLQDADLLVLDADKSKEEAAVKLTRRLNRVLLFQSQNLSTIPLPFINDLRFETLPMSHGKRTRRNFSEYFQN
jgi:hypothetical protein